MAEEKEQDAVPVENSLSNGFEIHNYSLLLLCASTEFKQTHDKASQRALY